MKHNAGVLLGGGGAVSEAALLSITWSLDLILQSQNVSPPSFPGTLPVPSPTAVPSTSLVIGENYQRITGELVVVLT